MLKLKTVPFQENRSYVKLNAIEKDLQASASILSKNLFTKLYLSN